VASKVLLRDTFIGGRIVLAGTEIDVDDNDPNLVIPAPSTPLANMSDEELEAVLRHRRKAPSDSRNLGDATDENTGRQTVPIADVTVRSAGSTRPQGAPPGSREHNGVFVAPAPLEAPAAVEAYVGEAPAAEVDGGPGSGLSDEEIRSELTERGVKFHPHTGREKLLKLLREPPKA